jgi:F0F1-type ATP synthase assembly protein I
MEPLLAQHAEYKAEYQRLRKEKKALLEKEEGLDPFSPRWKEWKRMTERLDGQIKQALTNLGNAQQLKEQQTGIVVHCPLKFESGAYLIEPPRAPDLHDDTIPTEIKRRNLHESYVELRRTWDVEYSALVKRKNELAEENVQRKLMQAVIDDSAIISTYCRLFDQRYLDFGFGLKPEVLFTLHAVVQIEEKFRTLYDPHMRLGIEMMRVARTATDEEDFKMQIIAMGKRPEEHKWEWFKFCKEHWASLAITLVAVIGIGVGTGFILDPFTTHTTMGIIIATLGSLVGIERILHWHRFRSRTRTEKEKKFGGLPKENEWTQTEEILENMGIDCQDFEETLRENLLFAYADHLLVSGVPTFARQYAERLNCEIGGIAGNNKFMGMETSLRNAVDQSAEMDQTAKHVRRAVAMMQFLVVQLGGFIVQENACPDYANTQVWQALLKTDQRQKLGEIREAYERILFTTSFMGKVRGKVREKKPEIAQQCELLTAKKGQLVAYLERLWTELDKRMSKHGAWTNGQVEVRTICEKLHDFGAISPVLKPRKFEELMAEAFKVFTWTPGATEAEARLEAEVVDDVKPLLRMYLAVHIDNFPEEVEMATIFLVDRESIARDELMPELEGCVPEGWYDLEELTYITSPPSHTVSSMRSAAEELIQLCDSASGSSASGSGANGSGGGASRMFTML